MPPGCPSGRIAVVWAIPGWWGIYRNCTLGSTAKSFFLFFFRSLAQDGAEGCGHRHALLRRGIRLELTCHVRSPTSTPGPPSDRPPRAHSFRYPRVIIEKTFAGAIKPPGGYIQRPRGHNPRGLISPGPGVFLPRSREVPGRRCQTRRPPTPLSLDGYHLCVYEEHICSSSSGDRRFRHAHPHITLMISMADTVRVFPRKPRAALCRERGKHIRRAYDTAPFSRRTTSSGIAFSLKDVYLSRALICGLFHGTLSSVGVVTTTANEKDAVCVHTTIPERKIPVCVVSAALQDVSPSLNKLGQY